MKIRKLETRQPWLCEVDGTTYIRTEIQWTHDIPNDITWHINEDQVKGKTYLTDEQLEKLFWENNVKINNPVFYSSNTDKHFTPEEKGWYIQYKTESGDEDAIKVDREPTSKEDALQLLQEIDADELWIVQYYAEVI